MPRRFVPEIVDEPAEVDIRSFGVRTPPCTRENPSYGILGLLSLLPPALAWLWRLAAPRGHKNPSITDVGGMNSEGVGTYWPFATGRQVTHANLLLRQIQASPATRCVLIPNQHIGAYRVGFVPQWIAREYLAHRGGARFAPDQLTPSRCALLGWSLKKLRVEGAVLPRELLEVHRQIEVGEEGYDAGARMLVDFFRQEISKYLSPDLDPLGRQIITCCMDSGSVEDYVRLMPGGPGGPFA